jgi:sulfatase modifying factor 1
MTPRGSEPPIFAMRRRRRRRQWWGLGLLLLICAGAAYGWYARSILTQPPMGPYSSDAGLASDWQPEAPIPSAGPESTPESETDGTSESEPATGEGEPVGGESEPAGVAGAASGTKPKAGATGAKRPGKTLGAPSGGRAPGGKTPRDTAGAGATSVVTVSEPPPAGVDTKTWEKDGSVMVRVPGGSFQMGAKSGEAAEGPPHSVTLPTFWIDRNEVTNRQYKRFVDATNRPVPYVAEAWAAPHNWDRAARTYPEGQGDMPVVLVSWDDAAAYARWAGKRLPTEAEWEYAARGSKATAYPWGDEWDSARCNSLASDPFDETPAPVGSFPRGASWCGALDMAGNVWEWVADWFAADYYAASPASSPAGPATGRYRCMRGGSWGSPSELCRSYSRGFRPPYARSDAAGFRCAADD